MPLEYYGLSLSEAAQLELHSFEYRELAIFAHELTFMLISLRHSICTVFSTQALDDEISNLPKSLVIACLRWVSDRLDLLQTLPAQEVQS